MKKLLPVLLVLLLLTSCTFHEEQDDGNRAEKGVYPDMVLTDATYQIGQSGEDPIVMHGKTITFYSADNLAYLEGFSFEQTDKDGNLKVSGGADKGTINLKSKSMELYGSVTFRKDSDGMSISADSLSYNSEKGEIIADGRVMIDSKDGSFEGTGFRGDLNESSYAFDSIEKGELNLE